jgi:alpha-methylacyl-CoA racemase
VTGCLSLFHEMPALPLADLFAAYEGALALAAALDGVARGGSGTRVVTSMSEALKVPQGVLIRQFRETRVPPRPGETLFSGLYPCYRLYSTRDARRVSLGAIEEKFWVKACEVLGVPQLVEDGYAIGERGREVSAKVQGAFESRDWEDWAPLFETADCCVEPVLDYAEAYGGV